MGNTESKQDHYHVLGVDPDATETRITKAFRNEALKWHPERRTPGNIDEAYRILSNPKKRAAYDASRCSDREEFGKEIFYMTCLVVVGYLTYKHFRRGNLKEIAKAAPTLSASTVEKICQATMEKSKAIVNWAFKWMDSDAASSLAPQLASSASTAASASNDVLSKVTKWFQN